MIESDSECASPDVEIEPSEHPSPAKIEEESEEYVPSARPETEVSQGQLDVMSE